MRLFDAQICETVRFKCPYCELDVASDAGVRSMTHLQLRFCPNCNYAVMLQGPTPNVRVLVPRPKAGNPVPNLPQELEQTYEEARACVAGGAHTAAALLCRRILMHVAVHRAGAPENVNFVQAIEHVKNVGYLPPNAEGWVNWIRQKGNEAAHSVRHVEAEEGEKLLRLSELLLRFAYDGELAAP